jgi:ribonuclease D
LPLPVGVFAVYLLQRIEDLMKRHADSGPLESASSVPTAIITDSNTLRLTAERLQQAAFLAVDTEFMRERTYYPQLCLIQVSDGTEAVAIDPLAKGLDLAPLWALMRDQTIVKVFHAGQQDMEIFLHQMGQLPSPIYDTQLAAMVCGLGDQVGYDKLVKAMLGHDIDKTSRFTDWSKRPLSNRQITYALDDVIYLAKLYPKIRQRIADEGRTHWLDEEYAKSNDPATYVTQPEEAWQRLKIRNMRPAALLRLMHLAAWRETEAQKRDLPRNRVLRDETLIDLAGSNPSSIADFGAIRNFPGGKDGKLVAPILAVLRDVLALPDSALPAPVSHQHSKKPPVAVMELLRVLLKHVTDEHNIAPRLIASADDLELLAKDDDAPIRALAGWRRDVFGDVAIKLKHGQIALAVKKGRIQLVPQTDHNSQDHNSQDHKGQDR